jgi:hypothetical protein
MNYLYGDSTEAPLRSNFLEFLRDAVDFSASVLTADEHIKNAHARLVEQSAEAERELERLARLVAGVRQAVDEGDKGSPDSPAARCAAQLVTAISDSHRSTVDHVQQSLAEARARLEADDASTRAACRKALASLLTPHDPHDSDQITLLSLTPDGHYDASLTGSSPFGLEWAFALVVPEGSPWASPLRVETLAPRLELRAPQLTGWISKEVKVRPQKLDRHVVTELTDDGSVVSFKLRLEPSAPNGFDVEVDLEPRTVTIARVGPEEDASVGAFEVEGEDVALLVDLATRLRGSIADLRRGELSWAQVDGTDFDVLPSYAEFVERFVAFMAPIVREISERSLTTTELVIRRPLGNDRREEIFVTKATLRDKYADLSASLRATFAPLGFEDVSRTRPPSVAPAEPPVVRAELAPSQPPPPPLAEPSAPFDGALASLPVSQPPPVPRFPSERVREPFDDPEVP